MDSIGIILDVTWVAIGSLFDFGWNYIEIPLEVCRTSIEFLLVLNLISIG